MSPAFEKLCDIALDSARAGPNVARDLTKIKRLVRAPVQ